MGESQIILRESLSTKDHFSSKFLAEYFDVTFFHNMPNQYKFPEKNTKKIEM
jgi:hypothetical protein